VPVIQRMASVQVLPLANYANGTRVLGPIDIADDVSSVDISIARCTTPTPTIWPNASTVVTITPEVSIDGGVSWSEAGKSVSGGGISIGRSGSEIPFSLSGGSLPAGTGRKYRCTVDIAGGPLRSSATVEVN
jgi:hypothetical protein